MKRRYKVLDLPKPYLHDSNGCCLNSKPETSPVFNRDGWYYDRLKKISWLEIDSKAYIERTDYFVYSLKLTGARRLEDYVYKSIGIVLSNGFGDKGLGEIYLIEQQLRILRIIKLEATRYRRTFINDCRRPNRRTKEISR